MFSFKKGGIKPVAVVEGGDMDGEVLYLYRKDKSVKEMPRGFFDMVELPEDSVFQWFPDVRENFSDVISMTAPRGQGKSTLASNIAQHIKEVFKLRDDDVIVCKKSQIADPAFDDLNPSYCYIDEEFLENPLTCDEISPDKDVKVVILDDLDTINSAKLKKAYVQFQDNLLQEGRKYNIYVIICAHRLTAHKDTKAILTESTYMLWFPDGVTSDFKYALKTYCDISTDVIKDLKNINSRWVMFHQHSPRFILTEHKAFIFDLDREEERLKDIKEEKKERRLLKRVPYSEQASRRVKSHHIDDSYYEDEE